MKQNENKFNYTYDILRFLAIITVVIGHSTYMGWGGDGGNIEVIVDNASPMYYSMASFLERLREWIYGFHMPLFFMISGAVYNFSKNIDSFDAFFRKKVKRLIIPYYLIGLLYMLPVKYFSDFYDNKTIFIAIQNFLIGGSAGHFWFLISLVWVFVIFYFLEKYIFKKSIMLAPILMYILYNFNVYSIFDIKYINIIPGLSRALYYLPFFIAGYVFEILLRKKITTKVNIFIFAVSFILSIAQFKDMIFTGEIIKIIIASLFLYTLSSFLALSDKLVNNKLFKILRRNTFEIYLYHDPINFIALKLANKYSLLNSNDKTLLFFFIRTIGAIIISVLLSEFIRFIINKFIKNKL